MYGRINIILKKVYRKIFSTILFPMFRWIFPLFPICRNRIVFDNFGGKGYGDNPKYIAEELIRREQKNLDLIWLVDNLSVPELPPQIRAVKIDSFRGMYFRATAKLWIDNVRHLHPIKKKSGQVYLQTWHAPFTPKKVEADAEDKLGEKYCTEAKYDGSITDAILVDSKQLEDQYRRAFWLNDNVEYLRFGLPRNDFLVKNAKNTELAEELKKKYRLEQNVYHILYAPTFRDDYSIAGYQLDYNRILAAFEKKLGKKCRVIVRLHPNAAMQSKMIAYNENIVNGSFIPDIQQLSLISDCVISDYSTSLFDFTILNKPAFICALDLEEYERMRGLLKEFYQFPFPFARTNDELIFAITSFDEQKYFDKVNAYLKDNPMYGSGTAAKLTADWLIKQL